MMKSTAQTHTSERTLKGIPISEGIAVGNSFFLKVESRRYPEFHISLHEVDREIERYRSAIRSSKIDLLYLQKSLQSEGSTEAVSIIDSHIEMLDDPFITVEIEEKIRHMMRNTEAVFHSAITDYEKQFAKIADHFFQQRLIDVRDLSERILNHLLPSSSKLYSNCPVDSIIFAQEITPSHTAEASYDFVKAFVSQTGGKTSHAALIARAKGIPYVADIDLTDLQDMTRCPVIVDGNEGLVIINPSPECINEYKERYEKHKERYRYFKKSVHIPAMTQDQVPVEVMANIENLIDIPKLFEYQVPAIGLLRSEFFFLQDDIAQVTEDQQLAVYERLIQETKEIPITFRVFDIGGDKNFSSSLQPEANPALGCRSIRYLLRNPHILYTQLKAIIKTTQGKNLNLLFPLISDVSEIHEVKDIVHRVQKELGIITRIPIGAMIEVPSIAIMIDAVAKSCDFISIGTNDLIQYTLAVDRQSTILADLYRGCHPSIVRLLKLVMEQSKACNIPVSICGEMASNPLYTPLLLGLGFNRLSCSPRHIPMIKYIIRKTTSDMALKLVSDVLNCYSYKQTYDLLEEYHRRFYDD